MAGQESLGQVITRHRKAKRLSRPAVAVAMSERLGLVIDQSYIARIENGKITRPDKARLKWLAGYLGIKPALALQLADYDTENEAPGQVAGLTVPMREAIELLGPLTLERQSAVIAAVRAILDFGAMSGASVEPPSGDELIRTASHEQLLRMGAEIRQRLAEERGEADAASNG